MSPRPRLFLIDGTALAYRSYFAFKSNPLVNSRGQDTSAVFGFTSALLRLMEKESPDRVAVVFDTSGPTFRHKKFADYKATREKMPDEMAEQLPLIDPVVEALGLPILRCPGYEADDVIGTLALRAESAGWDCRIVTGDKDFMQLVNNHILLYDLMKRSGTPDIIDTTAVVAKFGVPPEKVTDVLGLMGDSSDNVPGVKGIGEKTAIELIRTYGSLEAALDHADEVKGKRAREGLQQQRAEALLSKELVTIDTQVPVEFDAEALGAHEPDAERLMQLFTELEFPSLMDKVRMPGVQEKVDYHIVRAPEAFDALLKTLRRAKEFVLDLETTSINPMQAEIVGLSFAVKEKEAFYVPACDDAPVVPDGGLFAPQGSQVDTVLDQLRPVLESAKTRKGGQNIKYDLIVLAQHGVEVAGVAFDTMVESYVLDPGQRQHNLDLLALKHLSFQKIPTSDLIGTGKNQITMREVPIETVGQYACEDADITLRLHRLFTPQLDEQDLVDLYRDVEMPLVTVLVRMERRGLRIDLDLLASLSDDFAKRIDGLTADIYALADEEFNINSTQQLGGILYE
ncbi:DNA polymerase I, partial [bacterium]|nr:DNA polymerase I [bacterium]